MFTFGSIRLRHASVDRTLLGRVIVALLLASACQAVFGTVNTGDSPPCAADNICNLAVCSNDPDCPAGVSGNTNHPTDSDDDNALDEVIDCDSTQEKDVRVVAWNIADDWIDFRNAVENATGKNLGDCMQDRFSKNGKVQCVAKEKCNKDGECKLGFGGGLKQKVKIFETFLDTVEPMPQPDRRACYAALMTHEFSHTCEHYGEDLPEARAVAAFDYWKERFAVTPSLDPEDDCGLND
jgi:hypothetical protein